NTITPISGVENVKQGDHVTLQCSYTGAVQSLQWYRQYPGQALEYLLMSFETGGGSKANEEEHRISAELDKDNNRVFLRLQQEVAIEQTVPSTPKNRARTTENMFCSGLNSRKCWNSCDNTHETLTAHAF
ncbi:UNVERIFIED_CONTAM: hypothetical protein FKN15_024265, partial [Acipenser sinensis]